jgi:hypothetical protein
MKKFVAMLLAVALSLSSMPFAFAQSSSQGTENVGFQNIADVSFFKEITSGTDAQALIIVSLAKLLKEQQNSSEYGQGFYQLDTESPAYFRSFKGYNTTYFNVIYRSSYLGCYLLLNVSDDQTSYFTITPSDFIGWKDSFFAIGDPYETPEQITAYLDSQGYPYDTISPETLAEVQASLESN